MRGGPRRWAWLLTVWAVLCAASPAGAVSADAVSALHALVSDWQTVEARETLARLKADDPTDVGLLFAEARLLYFEGRYGEAVALLDQLLTNLGDTPPKAIVALREEVGRTHEALKGFDEFVTPDKRFLIRYTGRDRALIPWLVEVLQKADAALSADFDWRPQAQVVVEIYPRIEYLAKVSPLTEEAIETSGTIALCKYNRLMFTSPRGLVKGYGWRDTVTHEFVHYYVTKKSRNTVPIWLHEGIAKFQETRWRTGPGEALDPPQEDLLARALKADELVTFEQMHPSMALLPSQEAAALAFAEVHTVIDYLHGLKGYAGLNGLLDGLKAGRPMDAALKAVYGRDLKGLWAVWKAAMLGRGYKQYPGLVRTTLKFKRPGQDEEAELESDLGTITEKRVKDFTHLGELLRARDRFKGAAKEYRKAMALGGDGNPVIQNGLARSLLAADAPAEVPDLLAKVERYYPTYLTTFLNLGEAHLKLGHAEQAIAAFEAAVGINPFHPRPHAALVALYTAAGQTERAARAQQSLEILK